MQLPRYIIDLIENETSIKEITEDAKNISLKYRNNKGDGKRLVKTKNEAIAYALSRMPATYGVIYSILNYIKSYIEEEDIKSVIDIGAGTGAASIAISNFLNQYQITCLERENAMIEIGKLIMRASSNDLRNAKWIKFDAERDVINESADLAIMSYMLNEIKKDKREEFIKNVWKNTNKLLIIAEPGTPEGYRNIINAREILLKEDAHIVAPCPHEESCKIKKDDWCNFSCRIERNKIHRNLKGGEVPYEDEKYIYLVVSHNKYENSESRVLRHPIINKGYIKMKLCTKEGIQEVIISKKDGELYKKARKSSAGDSIQY